MKKDTIRLIIWGILFAIAFACGVIGLTTSKAKQRAYQSLYEYNNVE